MSKNFNATTQTQTRFPCGALAGEAGFEVNSYMQRILRLHALTWPDKDVDDERKILPAAEHELIFWSQWLIDAAVRKAREMQGNRVWLRRWLSY